jgi:hypothetical protein
MKVTEHTMSNSPLPTETARAPRWFTWLALLALAGYAVFLCGNTTITAGGSDSSGYLNSARLLANGRYQGELRLPALLVLIGLHWRKLAWLCAAGLPAALWLVYYNNELYGGPLRSGYGQWQLAFSLGYFPLTALHFARWLLVLLPGVLLFTPIAGVFSRGYFTRQLLALGLWFGAIAGLYAFYEVSHEVWWCLRFILPAIPALIFAGLLGITTWGRGLPPERREGFLQIATAVVISWAVGASLYWTELLGVRLVKQYENAYAEAAIASRGILPANALVVAFQTSGAVYYYTQNPILRWDQVEAAQFALLAKLAQAAGRPIYALIFNAEEKQALRERCPGDWTRLTTVHNLGLWLLSPEPVPHAMTPQCL